MEIKILVKEHEQQDLQKFIDTCKLHGLQITREGGGNLPNFSGYYAQLEGEGWKEPKQSDSEALNTCDVSVSFCDIASPKHCYYSNKFGCDKCNATRTQTEL